MQVDSKEQSTGKRAGQAAQIVLRDVHFRYGDAPVDDNPDEALRGISLNIQAGEHVCILGANGSGKSTLVQLMNGLLTPTAGTAEVFGVSTATDEGAASIRHRAAMVFQHPEDQMVTSIVADDVAFGPENLGVPSTEIAQRVDAALDAVDMTAHAHDDPADLSGGQQQRVAIAGALAMEPEVLLLDEPAAMLDAAGRHAIQDIVRRLNERGITIVHVTHFMDDALAADRAIVLDHGRIALDGTPGEVFAERATIHRLGLELPFAEELAGDLERAVPELGPLPHTASADEFAAALAQRLRDDRGTAKTDETQSSKDGNNEETGTRDESGAAAGTTSRPGDAPAIAFHDVSFSYADERSARKRHRARRTRRDRTGKTPPLAVESLTFEVPRGSLTALVGHTGSGKSTTVELACALKLPRTGQVTVGGIPTDDFSRRRELRAQVGYVSQLPNRQLFAETVFDDVAFGPRNLGLSEDEVTQRVTEALELTGLTPSPDMLGRSPFALSGGQQRSVALAGVLALKTPLLVLDEPMAGLDPQGRTRMHTLIERLRTAGTTILMVTHSMDDVAELADHVLVLSEGRLVAEGTPREVFGARELAPCVQSPHPASNDTPTTIDTPTSAAPGLPAALAFARRLEGAGVPIRREPLTRHELVDELAACARTVTQHQAPAHTPSTTGTSTAPDAPAPINMPATTGPTAPSSREEVAHGAAR